MVSFLKNAGLALSVSVSVNIAVSLVMLTSPSTIAQENSESHEEGALDKGALNKDALDKRIIFSPEKIALANIKIESITPQIRHSTVYAPGEIKVMTWFNGSTHPS